ncbi:MAG: L-threonylcarbamoyladenylate synthase, partial [Actinomycetota bacterium]
VYGLAARIDRREAVARIFDLKGRPRSKPLPVLVPDLASARRLAVFSPEALGAAEEGWPGPHTLVLERAECDADLGGDGATIALRVPDHPFALELLRRSVPLAATSANRSGQPVRETVVEVVAALGERVDLYVDGGRLGTAASTVISLLGKRRVLRSH